MPVHRTSGGGYQWGSHGKVYYGKSAKKKAAAQGRAAHAHGYSGVGPDLKSLAKKVYGR